MNVLTSITANSPKVEINNHHLVNKQNVVYSYDEISFNHEKEVLIHLQHRGTLKKLYQVQGTSHNRLYVV